MNDNDDQRGRVLKFRAKRRRAAYPPANDDELDAEAIAALNEELAREIPTPPRDEEFYREALRLTALAAEQTDDSGEPRDGE
jgi:hypothetical protein